MWLYVNINELTLLLNLTNEIFISTNKKFIYKGQTSYGNKECIHKRLLYLFKSTNDRTVQSTIMSRNDANNDCSGVKPEGLPFIQRNLKKGENETFSNNQHMCPLHGRLKDEPDLGNFLFLFLFFLFLFVCLFLFLVFFLFCFVLFFFIMTLFMSTNTWDYINFWKSVKIINGE